jgi:hypothetical protein
MIVLLQLAIPLDEFNSSEWLVDLSGRVGDIIFRGNSLFVVHGGGARADGASGRSVHFNSSFGSRLLNLAKTFASAAVAHGLIVIIQLVQS